ncbi:hypothetical protein [Spiroplasma endosymbiont of Megaselia nigra]|uniref:hypothetical protein n=1 Tax=Spiroplasma endosymbiont of Megaselia nigra TaxID=2478537 RepID=UPI000F89378B|nr:hypothetical protein [Spiroplasma endosymbiont of Megaselia nigra]RUO86352.1 hypothetical protein D9R21_03570 [Spiroplasma endosymbiont of Megaselia nigra]
MQITSWSNNVNNKIKEIYLQSYYTNDMKLKIRFSKALIGNLSAKILRSTRWFWGNKDYILLNINNPNILGIRNKSDNPVKITFKPR